MGEPSNKEGFQPGELETPPTSAAEPERHAFQFTLLQMAKVILVCALVFGAGMQVYKTPMLHLPVCAVLPLALAVLSLAILRPGPARGRLVLALLCIVFLEAVMACLGVVILHEFAHGD
jgi:hypothetical protein